MRSFALRFTFSLLLLLPVATPRLASADEIGTFYAQSGLTHAKQVKLAQLVADHLADPTRETHGALMRFLLVQDEVRDRIVERSQRSLRIAARPGYELAKWSATALAASVTSLLSAVGTVFVMDGGLSAVAVGAIPSAYLFVGSMFGGLGAYLKTDAAQMRDWSIQMTRFEAELSPFFQELARLGWRLETYQKQALSSRVFRLFTHPCQISLGGVEELIRG